MIALVLLAAACSSATRRSATVVRIRATTTTVAPVRAVPPTATTLPDVATWPTSTTATIAAPPTTTSPRVTAPHATLSTTAPIVAVPNQTVPAGNPASTQVVVVKAPYYGATSAAFTAYQRDANGWHVAFGPWTARIGRNGFAPVGAKREGDGRTPTGAFGFGFFFGVYANPGVRFAYRSVTGPSIVWNDDSSSPNYNLWVDTSTDPNAAGVNPEPMDRVPAYSYGAVIAYNTARVPHLGSAIFLHVSHGSSTAGCVSLPTSQLLSVLRWLDPRSAPEIIMGVGATIAAP